MTLRLLKIMAFLSPLAWLKASIAKADLPEVGVGLEGATETLEQVGTETELGQTSLPALIGNIINIVLGLLGLIFVVLIVYGGFLWMTAGGGKEQIDKAKGILTNSIIGLIIVIAAYAISAYVIQAVVTAATG